MKRLCLPDITAKIAEDLEGSSLLIKGTNGKWDWTQNAVDFVCILQRQRSELDMSEIVKDIDIRMFVMLTRVISEIAGNMQLLHGPHAFEAVDPLFELMHDVVVLQKKVREREDIAYRKGEAE